MRKQKKVALTLLIIELIIEFNINIYIYIYIVYNEKTKKVVPSLVRRRKLISEL